ncbi:MAG: quinolinate synthase [Candidatus Aminicenantes bacterium RBG_19FT_COMBO_58_17]|nr:MAG: quinolinate synthase [Candidatus Aminicenantes bacterium RBG_19FT_COMBO_58_17]
MTKAEVLSRIAELRKERKAVILAHNYQIGEVQDIADYTGDSLGLSQEAARSGAEVIVFCGVHFMAETAAILSPQKAVLLPDLHAGCPMADMITAQELRDWKARYPGRKVVSYVNTTAEVKAESDICCTSSNAVRVVNSLPDDEILFAPDKNLAAYIARQTTKKIIAWDGYCYVHNQILAADVLAKKERYPAAEVWVHPECRPEVIDLADKVISTGNMVKAAQETSAKEVLIGTEAGILHRLRKENPRTAFFPVKDLALCTNMKKINLIKVWAALEEMKFRIEVPAAISQRARGAIEKMIQI